MTLLPDHEHREGQVCQTCLRFPMMSTERDRSARPVPGSLGTRKPVCAAVAVTGTPTGSVEAFRLLVREIRGPAPPEKAWSLLRILPGGDNLKRGSAAR
jgi:hypothetical protein